MSNDASMQKLEPEKAAIRDLLLAIEYMRSICENAEGRSHVDRLGLAIAMRVGIRMGARYGAQITDYQMDSFWDDVRALPKSLDLRLEVELPAVRMTCPGCGYHGLFPPSLYHSGRQECPNCYGASLPNIDVSRSA